MARLLGPWSVGYPVRFYSGGDTTREAFRKHISEIERIYGLLNALDRGKAGTADISDALTNHINSSNPHPNWKPKMSMSDLTGTIDFSRITGDLDASRVTGLLSRARIDASHVNNLEALIKELIQGNAPKPEQFPIGYRHVFSSLPTTIPGDSSTRWQVSFPYIAASGSITGGTTNRTFNQTLGGGTVITASDCPGGCYGIGSITRIITGYEQRGENSGSTPIYEEVHSSGTGIAERIS